VFEPKNTASVDKGLTCEVISENFPEIECLEGKIETINSSCWYTNASINGINTDILIDTGSTYTIVDIDFYNSIEMSKRLELRKININLRNANGQTLHVHGETELQIEIGKEIFNFPVKVVSLGDKSTILGLDFMEEYDCILYMSKGILKLRKYSIKLHRINDTRCARVQVTENVIIPPRHEMVISGKVSANHWVSFRNIGLVESIKSVHDNMGILIGKTLVSTNNSELPVRVANVSNDPIIIQKGSTIGILHPVNEVTKYEVNTKETKNDGQVSIVIADNKNYVELLPDYLKPLVKSVSDKLSENETNRFAKLISDYKDIFMSPEGKLGCTHLVTHKIDTGDCLPVKQRPRRLPITQQELVDKELDKMEAEGLIEDSESEWSSPLVIV
jgi:hypothetical protein